MPLGAAPGADTVLRSAHVAVEAALSEAWRSNADAMSVLYAGTPALKTRLGPLGKLQDGLNSVTRYWINNFRDGAKQDVLDLFLGNFDVHSLGRNEDVLVRARGDETLLSMLAKAAFVFLAAFMLGSLVAWERPAQHLRAALWTTLAVAFSAVAHALRKGLSRAFVAKPRLCPTD